MHRSIVALGALVSLAQSGCMFLDVAEQQEAFDALCLISGTVTTEAERNGPLVVGLVHHAGGGIDEIGNWTLADHFVLESEGPWMFLTLPGTYGLVAFDDSNSDGVYQTGEPFLRLEQGRALQCASNGRMLDLALVIPAKGSARLTGQIDFMTFEARSLSDQQKVSLGQLTVYGKVTTIDDPKFSDDLAVDSLWRPFDFILNVGAGVYFLEPYDPSKIPVLFVHGINGNPSNFRRLIERLDRAKYQPWVYYYPSGARLDVISGHLDQTINTLRLQYGFPRLHVLAHSMGGLVTRGFLLRNQSSQSQAKVPLYITISTPWGGHQGAAVGVKYSPAVVRVWNDMMPDSPYIHGLFFETRGGDEVRRPLPAGTKYHLLFGFKNSGGESSDGTVTAASQLDEGAQMDATRLYGFDETHTSILESERVSQLVNRLLDDASR